MIRAEIRELVSLGPLPDSSADDSVIERFEELLGKIDAPVDVDEARALLGSFGDDDCFGLAWTLVHLIESSPTHPLESEPDSEANEWLRLLWDRAH